jgi:hypothetical protein
MHSWARKRGDGEVESEEQDFWICSMVGREFHPSERGRAAVRKRKGGDSAALTEYYPKWTIIS